MKSASRRLKAGKKWRKPLFFCPDLENLCVFIQYQAQGGKRVRWSVAFPIVESYKIIDPPLIKDVLSEDAYKSIIQRSSATLRELSDEDRKAIAGLEIVKVETRNSWIAIEDEFRNAEVSEINPDIYNLITADFPATALEGETEERKSKIKKRAAWLAALCKTPSARRHTSLR